MEGFDLEVLGRISNDYEAIHTIRGDLERDLLRSVAGSEIAVALLRLVELGFVDAFIFDSAANSYVRVTAEDREVERLWFMINARGRTEYERLAA